jgi:hypothetical protein
LLAFRYSPSGGRELIESGILRLALHYTHEEMAENLGKTRVFTVQPDEIHSIGRPAFDRDRRPDCAWRLSAAPRSEASPDEPR